MELKGLRSLIICKKEINEELTSDFLSKYENLRRSLVFEGEELERLFNEIESELKLIAIIGMKERIRKGCLKCI